MGETISTLAVYDTEWVKLRNDTPQPTRATGSPAAPSADRGAGGASESDVLEDPITLAQAAVLATKSEKTLYNKKDRPEPAIPQRGSQPIIYSFAKLRPWLVGKWPNEAYRVPEDYEAAKKLWKEVAAGEQGDADTKSMPSS